MNLKELKEIIEIVSEKAFAEFEIDRQGFRLRISRFQEQPSSAGQVPAATQSAAPEHSPKAAQQDVSRGRLVPNIPAAPAERRVAEPDAAGEATRHLLKAPI